MEQTLGAYIKQRRLAMQKTLLRVANETGLSAAYLSLVERDKTSPTIANLHKICLAVHTTVAELFASIEANRLCVRGSERQVITSDQTSLYESLTNGNHALVALCMHIYDNEEHPCGAHVADEVGYILQGTLLLTNETMNAAFELHAGDSVYIAAGNTHHFRKLGEEESVSLWVSPSTSYHDRFN